MHDAGEITVDYDGTSEASPWGINVVMNYTHAYTTFTVRSVLNPDIPNNHGSLGPSRSRLRGFDRQCRVAATRHGAPRGGDVPSERAPQGARTGSPEAAMAEGSGAVWTMQVNGNHPDGSPFITAMFTYAGVWAHARPSLG